MHGLGIKQQSTHLENSLEGWGREHQLLGLELALQSLRNCCEMRMLWVMQRQRQRRACLCRPLMQQHLHHMSQTAGRGGGWLVGWLVTLQYGSQQCWSQQRPAGQHIISGLQRGGLGSTAGRRKMWGSSRACEPTWLVLTSLSLLNVGRWRCCCCCCGWLFVQGQLLWW